MSSNTVIQPIFVDLCYWSNARWQCPLLTCSARWHHQNQSKAIGQCESECVFVRDSSNTNDNFSFKVINRQRTTHDEHQQKHFLSILFVSSVPSANCWTLDSGNKFCSFVFFSNLKKKVQIPASRRNGMQSEFDFPPRVPSKIRISLEM